MSLSSWLSIASGTAPSFQLSPSTPIEGQTSLVISSQSTSLGSLLFLNKDSATSSTGYISTRFKFPSAISTDSQIALIAVAQSPTLAIPNAYYWTLQGSNLTQMILTKTGPTASATTTLPLGTTVATDGTVYAIGMAWDFRTPNNVLRLLFGTPNIAFPYGISILASTVYTDVATAYGSTNVGCGLIYNKSGTGSPQSNVTFDYTIIGDPTGRIDFRLLQNENWESEITEPSILLLHEGWEPNIVDPDTILTFTVTGITTDFYERW